MTALICPSPLTIRLSLRPMTRRDIPAQPADRPHDRMVRVSIGGMLDIATAAELTAYLSVLVQRHSTGQRRERPGVELDLTTLSFLDTAGLTSLDASRNALDALGWSLCVTSPAPNVVRLLEFAVREGWLPADLNCPSCGRWPEPVPPMRDRPLGAPASHFTD